MIRIGFSVGILFLSGSDRMDDCYHEYSEHTEEHGRQSHPNGEIQTEGGDADKESKYGTAKNQGPSGSSTLTLYFRKDLGFSIHFYSD
tara:strand:- start:40 stop:303 length:264 start_codon:yes stop_codon:yes gene_type:complete